ncbi:MAG TPA: hypothetical protein VK625_13235 [Flavitalea sp.]|nr:hypothetical protein [Flavitalea sp.]
MRNIFLAFSIFLFACNSGKKDLQFEDSSNKFYVKMEESKKGVFVDTLYTFYDLNHTTTVKEIGFYKDGFRNDVWSYNLPTEVRTIKWGYYKDKYLNYETNLFEKADSVKHGDFFTNFLFTTSMGKVVLNISVNGAFKDSLPEKNYERITKNEFSMMGAALLMFDKKKLSTNTHDIYINKISVKTPANAIRYIKSCFSFIDKNHFIEFSVSTSNKNDFYANALFDAVLTGFSIDGKRLYNPFKTIE